MRVLLLPFQSDSKMTRCSVYHWIKIFVRELTRDGDVHVYWPVPEGQRPPDEFLNEYVTLIPMDKMRSSPYYEMTYVDEELLDLFNSMKGTYVVDVIVNFKPMLTPYIKRRLTSFLKFMAPPVINVHPFLIAGSRFAFLHDDFRRMQAAGMVGKNVYSNEAHEYRGIEAIRPFLSGTEFKKVETLGYYFSAFDPKRMDRFRVEKPKKPITLCYAQAMNETFKHEEVLEELDLLYKAGRDVKLLITTSSDQGKVFPEHYEYVEQHGTLPQHEFMKKLHEGHVFVALIKDMEMCSSMLEQMYAGQIGILPDKPWARSMTPDGYPFLYKSTAEMRAMLRKVVENYWDYEDLVEEVREFIVERYDGQKLCTEFRDKLKEERDRFFEEEVRMTKGIVELIESLNRTKIDKMTWGQVVRFFKKYSRMGLNLKNVKTKGHTVSRWSVHWIFQRMGWVDTCKEEMPVYRRQL